MALHLVDAPRAAQHFAEHRLTALLIGHDAEGIFTEHDIVRLVGGEGAAATGKGGGGATHVTR